MKQEFDYGKLEARISAVFGSHAAFAKAIHLDKRSFQQRMSNQSEFSQREMFLSAQALGLPYERIPEYFFTEKVQKNESLVR